MLFSKKKSYLSNQKESHFLQNHFCLQTKPPCIKQNRFEKKQFLGFHFLIGLEHRIMTFKSKTCCGPFFLNKKKQNNKMVRKQQKKLWNHSSLFLFEMAWLIRNLKYKEWRKDRFLEIVVWLQPWCTSFCIFRFFDSLNIL